MFHGKNTLVSMIKTRHAETHGHTIFAVRTFSQLFTMGREYDTVKRYCSENRPEDAHRLLLAFKKNDVPRAVQLIFDIVYTYARLNKVASIMNFLLDIRRQGLMENLATAKTHIKALFSIGASMSAWAYLTSYHTLNGIRVESATFQYYMSVCSDVNLARKCLLEAKETLGITVTSCMIAELVNIVPPTTYRSLVILEILQDAYQVFGITPDPLWLEVQLKKVSADGIEQLLEPLLTHARENFGIDATFAHYTNLFTTYCGHHDAFSVIRIVNAHNLVVPVAWINEMIDHHFCAKNALRLDLTDELFRNLDVKWNSTSFNAPIRMASTIYNMAKVQEYFSLMRQLKITPDTFAWNCLLRCSFNINGENGRRRTLALMKANNVKSDEYTMTVLKFTASKNKNKKLKYQQRHYQRRIDAAVAAGRALVV